MVTLAIMAGGKSTRMGYDKIYAPFLGQPLLERVINRLRPVAGEILIASGEQYYPPPVGVKMVVDKVLRAGPMAGIHACFADAKFPLVAVIACDMPFVSLSLFQELIQIAENNRVDAVIPESFLGLEPLHAVYRKDACLPKLLKSLNQAEISLKAWLTQLNVQIFCVDDVIKIDPTAKMFLNVNTPEELTTAQQLALETE